MKASLSPSAKTLRIVMISRDLSRNTLSSLTGLQAGTISNVMSGSQAGYKSRALIEGALGLPIWTTPEEYKRREELAQILGFNPITATLVQLQAVARDHQIPHRVLLNKSSLIRLLEVYFAETKTPRGRRRGVVKSKSFSRGRECRKPKIERGQ